VALLTETEEAAIPLDKGIPRQFWSFPPAAVGLVICARQRQQSPQPAQRRVAEAPSVGSATLLDLSTEREGEIDATIVSLR
jgi:hypothetical protein